ncbi:hypothetical protein FACS189429_7940 [Bacteroidia bacterium]|nr:hypothetical protein FACS189429_7940 [Bacteroidia bacterium]
MNKYTLLTVATLLSTAVIAQSTAFDLAKKHFAAQNDTLKIRTLEFIENNIDEHYSRTYHWQDSVGNTVNFNEFDYLNFNESRKALKTLILKPVQEIVPDRKKLTAEQLIAIVERGFVAWGKQWNKNLNFDDFCDYLLPYRVQDEPFEDWYDNFLPKFSFLAKNSTGDICTSVNSNLKMWFFSSFSFEDRTELDYCLSPSQMLFRKQGNCQDLCNLSVYIMRMLGVACSIDFTPAWATSSYNHFWCTFIDENGEHRPFEGVTGMANDFVIFREPSKVFRITYRKQFKTLSAKIAKTEIPVSHLRMKNLIDVTDRYWKTTDLQCNLFEVSKNNISYISVFNALAWRPVDWAETDKGKASFTKLSVGVVYMPVNYENNKIVPAGYPVLIRSDKSKQELCPDYKNRQIVTVTEAPKYLYYRTGKKYTFFYWDKKWIKTETKTATEDKILTFDNIPSNTVYLLLPEYSERKERIFTVNEQGEIERW